MDARHFHSEIYFENFLKIRRASNSSCSHLPPTILGSRADSIYVHIQMTAHLDVLINALLQKNRSSTGVP